MLNLFPSIKKTLGDAPFVFLDNASTTQKPYFVINSINDYYINYCSNVHRGAYSLSETATDLYENARVKVCNFINAENVDEIVFTSGTTDSINLIASSFGEAFLTQGDEVLITELEHHSNIVPWQILCDKIGAILKVVPMNNEGDLPLNEIENSINLNTKILSLTHVSNVLGSINPVKEIIKIARKNGVTVVVDGAQAVAHMDINVKDIDADFYAFSSHKMYGPTGVGVLYGKRALLNKMPPYRGGGSMVLDVKFSSTTYADCPHKFEAGTPNVAGVIGLGAAIDFIQSIGISKIKKHESELLRYFKDITAKVKNFSLVGNPKERTGILPFFMKGVHPHDVSTILSKEGIYVRAGHMCAQPTIRRLNVSSLARISFAVYNTESDADKLASGLLRVNKVFNV